MVTNVVLWWCVSNNGFFSFIERYIKVFHYMNNDNDNNNGNNKYYKYNMLLIIVILVCKLHPPEQ